jgi:hypothetical protein
MRSCGYRRRISMGGKVMKSLVPALTLAIALALSAAGQAAPRGAKWVKYPTCTATSTTLTCTGSAVGIKAPFVLVAQVWLTVNYTCVENGFVGASTEATGTTIKNGKAFNLTFVPAGFPVGPEGIYQDECPSQNWTREDLSSYGVIVLAGGDEIVHALEARLGTISPP